MLTLLTNCPYPSCHGDPYLNIGNWRYSLLYECLESPALQITHREDHDQLFDNILLFRCLSLSLNEFNYINNAITAFIEKNKATYNILLLRDKKNDQIRAKNTNCKYLSCGCIYDNNVKKIPWCIIQKVLMDLNNSVPLQYTSDIFQNNCEIKSRLD